MSSPSLAPSAWRFDAIGTGWVIETLGELPEGARASVVQLIDRFDREWSRFRTDSLVSELSREPGERAAPPDTAPMLDLYARLSDATDGAVNPLVGASLAHRGYDSDYTLVDRGPVPAPADWRRDLTWSPDRIHLRIPATLDVGALGKGRLVDLVLASVRAHTHGPVVVDASGDIAVSGTLERIGLEHPYDPRRAIGVWAVRDGALCASAVNRRAWGDGLHHVLDARTGEPVRTVVATWAVAPEAMTADAVATALFFEGGAELAHAHGVSWVRMTSEGGLEWSPGCTAELFS